MDPPPGSNRVPNPNYYQNQSSYGPAPSQQPAVQQPPFDPFQKRDPFMPSHTPDRRDSHPPQQSALWHADSQPPRPLEMTRKDGLHPGPPPPQSFHAGPTLFKEDHMRRRSLGGSSMHNASPIESSPHHGPPPQQPPPGSYLTRHMPPPGSQGASAPSNSNGSRSALPTPPPPSASASAYGPPAFNARQNMSISSIMGNDNASLSRPPSSWSAHRNSGSGPSPHQPPHSPARSTHHSSSHQPEHDAHGPPFSPGRGEYHPAQYGPNQSRNATPPPFSQNGALPPRPYSQPAGSDPLMREHRDPHCDVQREREQEAHFANGYGDLEDRREDIRAVYGARDRSSSDLLRGRYDGPPHPRDMPSAPAFGPAAQERQGPFPRPAWASPVKQEEPRYGPVEYGPAPRPAEERRPYMLSAHTGPAAPGQLYNGMYPRSDIPVNGHAPDLPRYGPEPRPLDAVPMRPSMSNDSYTGKPVTLDASLRRSLEEGQMAYKKSLGGFQYDQRRVDRGSPLPQAVHGVSAQPLGIGRDPHVKIEFGRMFSGLGSGVGSTPQPINQPLGRPSSPPDDDGEPRRRSLYDYDGFPRSGRRNKRRLDDDRNDSGDSADGRGSPLATMRGAKKARHGHHHHHHLPPHHHHFAHRKPEDEMAYDDNMRRGSGTPRAMSRNPSAGGQVPLLHHHHHHHHHHLGHHHHHHAHRNAAQPAQSQLRQPVVEIRTSPLVKSVADRPRKHLGSQLYAPRVKLPSSLTTPLYTNHPYALEPNALPDFEGKENSTFTIRVPRAYLTASSRELILLQRRIWGTDVYTDDSDPICAAVHAGWVRGSWPEDVDESLLGLEPMEGSAGHEQPATAASELVLTSPPPMGPKAPPEGKDMKITILILPALEKYASSTWHGVRSRSWGSDHDGMSFKIEKIEFVDLGSGPLVSESGRAGDKAQQKRHVGPSAIASGVGMPLIGGLLRGGDRIKGARVARVGA